MDSSNIIKYDPKNESDSKKFKLNIKLIQKKSIEITFESIFNSMSYSKTFSLDNLKVKSRCFYKENDIEKIFNILNDLKEKKLYIIKTTYDDKCEIVFLNNNEENEEINLNLDLNQVEYSLNFMDFGDINKLHSKIRGEFDFFKKEYLEQINYMKTEFSQVLTSINNKFELFKKEIEEKLNFQQNFAYNSNNNDINNKDKNLNKNINIIQNSTEILELKKEINELKNKLFEMTSLLKKEEKNFLKETISPNKNITFDILFSSKEDGFDAEIFHKKCDNFNKTLTVILTENGEKIGGYTTLNWIGNGEEKIDKNSFVFDLKNKKIFKKKENKPSIICFENRGPMFGKPCDFGLKEDMQEGFSKKNGSFTSNLELTNGKENFLVKEIEVYNIKENK